MAIVINEHLVQVGAKKLAEQAFPGVAWSALKPEVQNRFCNDFREAFNAMSEAHDGREGRYHLDTVVYQRGDEWVLETTGTINDTYMSIRRTEPLSVPVEEVPELPSYKKAEDREAEPAVAPGF